MLYRFTITTVESFTSELCNSDEEAEAEARKEEAEINSHHHHGEKSTVTYKHVPYRSTEQEGKS